MIITVSFSERPSVFAWCHIIDAIADAYPGSELSGPVFGADADWAAGGTTTVVAETSTGVR
jgi:hypothetical protein